MNLEELLKPTISKIILTIVFAILSFLIPFTCFGSSFTGQYTSSGGYCSTVIIFLPPLYLSAFLKVTGLFWIITLFIVIIAYAYLLSIIVVTIFNTLRNLIKK